MKKILIIDDDKAIRKLLKISLRSCGFEVMESECIKDALIAASINSPELILLDLGLPDGDGLRFIKEFREWHNAPIIVISAISQENKKVEAFELGADDYLTKPFSTNELLARVKAFLRRYDGGTQSNILICDNLAVDLSLRSVLLDNIKVKLTPKEYDLLKILMLNSGKVLTHNMLLKEVWGVGYQNESHYLRVFINQLRQKIENDPSRPTKIITETGIGYRLSC